MKGLWTLRTTTLDPGLGIAIWNGVAALFIIALTISSLLPRKHKTWREARVLQTGLVLLSLYFLAHWIDLSCRHNELPTRYNYIIAGCFVNTIRALADVSVLWGLYIMMCRLDRLDDTTWTIPYFGILTFLAIYHICLLFALAFAWLAFADVVVVNSIARARNGFEIGFSALQFCFSLFLPVFVTGNGHGTGRPEVYRQTGDSLAKAGLYMLLRSFCEVVIVGQLDRWPKHFAAIIQAREVTYALFSLVVAVCAVDAIVKTAIEQDPLIEEQRLAMEEVQKWVTNQYDTLTEGGTKTAPKFDVLIKPLKTEVAGDMRVSQKRIKRLKLENIKRLEKFYENCEPIFRDCGITAISGNRQAEHDSQIEDGIGMAR